MERAGAGFVRHDRRASAGRATEMQHAVVDHVEHVSGTLRWTETEDGLPLPLSRDNANQALLLELTDYWSSNSTREPLRVTRPCARQLHAEH